MKFILLLPIMFFLHIVDDYYLQGVLAKMKQQQWWKDNTNDMDEKHQKLYQHDWIPALICHAFSWSFMIMLPILIYSWNIMSLNIGVMYLLWLIINTIIHAYVDHMKCNRLLINLIIDQSCHIVQIVMTWVMFMGILT